MPKDTKTGIEMLNYNEASLYAEWNPKSPLALSSLNSTVILTCIERTVFGDVFKDLTANFAT